MSQANVENLRAWMETWNGSAWTLERLQQEEFDVSLLDPEVTYDDTILPDHIGETYHGHEGTARAWECFIEPSEWVLVELEQIIDAGDRLVSIHRFRSKARYTGIEFDMPVTYLWTFRDGKVIHYRAYQDPKDALQAAALEE